MPYNAREHAKSFCITMLPMLTDKQYERTLEALTKVLEHANTLGKREGAKAQ